MYIKGKSQEKMWNGVEVSFNCKYRRTLKETRIAL